MRNATPILVIISSAALLCACGGAGAPSGDAPKIDTVVLSKSRGGAGIPAPAMPGVNVPAIKVNTVGWPTGWRKIAVFNVDPAGGAVRDASGRVALSIDDAMISTRGVDTASQDPVWQVDVSALVAPGEYSLDVGGARSDPFAIGDGVYDRAVVAGLKSFYFQRTRTALVAPYAVWDGTSYLREKASHVHGDVGWDLDDYPAKKRKWKVEGGWHDAGNYDMYVPSTAPAAQELLLAYEWDPSIFDDAKLDIPESGNGVPDILDEARWGLVWILSVQDANGGFRHRESVMEWSPECPADEDLTERWIAGTSSAGTAKAVAALAVAARVYAPFDAAFARRCDAAAKRGWSFLLANPERVRPDNKGSPQALWDDDPGESDKGALFIAAVEAWRAWRDAEALRRVRALMDDPATADVAEVMKGSWANMSRYGLMTLAVDEGTPAQLRGEAKRRLLAGADSLLGQVEEKDGYRCASTVDDYYWGSNSILMEKAHVLAFAARLAPSKPAYLEAARDQWHWILGRNPNGFSMVTRVGKGPARMYHMEWGGAEPPPPGYLLGGPNAQNLGFLSPGAPAKAILWQNSKPLRSGLPAGELWHWKESDLWDGGFLAEEDWTEGWWAATESDILYSAAFVLAGVAVR